MDGGKVQLPSQACKGWTTLDGLNQLDIVFQHQV